MPATAYARPRIPRPGDRRILKAIYDSVRQGHSIATAAANARIGETTARDWLREGEALLEANPGRAPAEQGSHALFAWTFKQAEAKFVSENLGVVHRDKAVAGKGWLPAMTLLERRRPQDFGRRDRQDVHIEQRTVVLNLEGTLPPEALLAAGQYLIAQAQLALPEGEPDS